MKKLRHTTNNLKKIYLKCYYLTTELLQAENLFEENNKAINIRKLADSLGIDIIEMKIHQENPVFTHGIRGYLDTVNTRNNSDTHRKLYIDKDMGDLTKRYIIAQEIGRYLLYPVTGTTDVYKNSLFSLNQEEQICDIFASFLLMPINVVIDIMNEYLCSYDKNSNADMYDWLKYLGFKLGISDYHTVICFQNIRYLAGIITENKQEFSKKIKKDYDNIYTNIGKLQENYNNICINKKKL